MAHLVDSADFERVLRSPSRARTLHFAVHHLAARSRDSAESLPRSEGAELSTISTPVSARPVDDSLLAGLSKRLGAVVPKRHARRAVTRSLLKRQVHAAARRYAAGLSLGLWIVRLRAPFDRTAFPSASSMALRLAARAELDSLFQAVARPPAP